MAQILTKQIELPKFNLPEPYNNDVWDITEWDYYKNASYRYKTCWKARSNVMGNKMDFSLCNSPVIREETKYFCYLLITDKKVTLSTFAEYADRFKLLFSYVNDKSYSTVLDIDTNDYERYIGQSHKIRTDNGSALIGSEVIPMKKRNRLISFVDTLKRTICDFIESSKPLIEKDYWKRKDVKGDNDNVTSYSSKNLDFSTIRQSAMKKSAKDFILFKLASITFGAAYGYLCSIKTFCQWLYEYDENINSFAEINRDIIEDYLCFLRIETDFSQHKINKNILDLSVMFEYGILNEDKSFPSIPIFLSSDYAFKTEHRAKYYTPDEIAGIFSVIPYIPKVYGKILLILHHCGMRISEVLYLPMDCLHYSEDVPYIKLYMYKTERNHNIPLSKAIHKIIRTEIIKNQKKHPGAKYVFLNDDGSLINYGTFCRTIRRAIAEHNILGRDGQPLKFGTHRFRSTKATDLINLGEDAQKTADILGVSSLSTLRYYATATQTSVNEHMQEYLRKESILINSIGKMDEFNLDDYENAIPLCNGWCCKPIDLGICDKINACLTCSQFRPSMKHLTSYRLQLSELESTLAVAEANGYTRIVEKCTAEKEALQNIINRLEKMLDEKKHKANGEL